MVLSIFLSIISIFNNLYVIILRRKITKISAFISTYLLVCRHCISNQWISEEIDEKKFSFLFLMNPEFHNKRTVLTPSFRPKRSGVEKSHTEAERAPWRQEISRLSVSINSKAFTPIPSGPPLEMRMSMSSIQSFSGGSTDQNAAPPPSFRPKRSGVEKSHAEAGRAPWWQKISRLSVSINSKAFIPIPSAPLEMTIAAGRMQPFPRNLLTKTLPRPRHFDQSETEKSHAEAGRAPWWQKISRLSVSIVSKAFTPIPAGPPPLEMTIASGSLSSYVISQKGL